MVTSVPSLHPGGWTLIFLGSLPPLLFTPTPFHHTTMHVLSVAPPALASRFSTDSGPVATMPTNFCSATPLVASLFVDSSQAASSPDTWMFDCHMDGDSTYAPRLGVGDMIAIYRQACVVSCQTGPQFGQPAFLGCLTHIAGWSSSTIEFGVEITSVFPTHPTTIQLPWAVCRLSLLQRLWGWLIPWPRCSSFHPPPLMPVVDDHEGDDLVWCDVDV
ncbi:hypothetical protein DEU56DRAFT_914731 [Suillus clintonianus]|uniref:uncharacterized protein n=1 Tax=Suillus clintonianus TaxID=1904413 RepID=UPI001B86011D|nr:uncharacterized protein DEU56DRAFT_914731 [Suillus clintonianus]KAG2130733.1 hypothetical protein DEU56DRAFT_914731 [Suillus clintonianus]